MSESGPVVSNSGPLIAVATVGQLDVLGSLYGSVLIPGAVFREVTEAGGGRPGALEVASATWIERVDVDPRPDRLLATELSFLGNSIFGIFGSRDRPSHPCVRKQVKELIEKLRVKTNGE